MFNESASWLFLCNGGNMNFILGKTINFLDQDDGVTSIEYALIATLIAVVIVSAVWLLGKNVSTEFSQVATLV
jgi:pilus assembly protein Flp/PilA